ncbi:MAG: Bifunctional thiamine biosynthesis protein ThiDN [Methanoregulaceae archaeon PtaB.Bin108]|nr:MAG: Bifunctional thiamine biosynthesis protein ThiDN [Methanoregulaceae archaeon PtaB.Bin108]
MVSGEVAYALTVAGSDSCGGAGIQADLKVFQALGVWGLSAITAVTAQNTREVRGIQILDPGIIALQVQAILDEFPISAVKTGMLADAATIRVVDREIPGGVPLVVDPVMVSTSRHELLEKGARSDLVEILLPRATIVTPNIPEAEVLSGVESIRTLEDAHLAGMRILDLGPRFVLVKGGHLPGDEAADLLLSAGGEWVISTPRFPFIVHGAGCCYSAAICAHLARGCTVQEAFSRSKEWMNRLFRKAERAPSGIFMLSPSGFTRDSDYSGEMEA